MIRQTYEIEGIVQGVGFRPAIYNLAIAHDIGGTIQNRSGKVVLILEGEEDSISFFIQKLSEKLPAPVKINSIKLIKNESCKKKSRFKILESQSDSAYKVSIPADIAICKECRNEIENPSDRRYRYPFTTCVNCGPRYTVVNAMPYDRLRTTLSEFKLCKECKDEYTNPSNRRFHAESIACAKCGPKLFLCDNNGNIINTDNCIAEFKKLIKKGAIVAVRGIGGYLLSLDAYNKEAIITLRRRKGRPSKPFAVMTKGIEIAKKYCEISPIEESLLTSPASPIVILNLKDSAKSELPVSLLSPDTDTLGVMLPYSPLHCLLFDKEINMLIMTSGNRRGEPVCIKNEEAFLRLNGIADAFLCHDREINLRNDDSLAIMQNGKTQLWRRARGFSPGTIRLNKKTERTILAMGPELKNTITLAFDNEAIISPHIGDLETTEAISGLEQAVKEFPLFFRKELEVIAVDMHPNMHSTILGQKLALEKNIPLVSIQHHHAHASSCMTEHNLEQALAVVFDGTGLGTDNTIWGAELLYVNRGYFERLATFKETKLLGGDTSVIKPVRQLISRWIDAGIDIQKKDIVFLGIAEEELALLKQQYEKNINSPLTHAAGRLFDSISVLLGIAPELITYEGETAIRLEAEANKAKNGSKNDIFTFSANENNGMLFIDWSPTFKNFSPEFKRKFHQNKNYLKLKQQYAMDFHIVATSAISKMVEFALSKTATKNIVLSGGVFMNKILTKIVSEQLSKQFKLHVHIHEKVPPNDGGVSLGQAIAASYVITDNSI